MIMLTINYITYTMYIMYNIIQTLLQIFSEPIPSSNTMRTVWLVLEYRPYDTPVLTVWYSSTHRMLLD